MDFLAQIITWINAPLNATAGFLLAPIGILPGWLSNTLISAVMGVVLLIIFKHTSNQQAIGRVRNNIKADMLALRLFKDSLPVTFRTQGQLFIGSLQLLRYALVPLLVMIVPVSLLLGQMGQWYQYRPLPAGEETVVSMKLNGEIDSPMPDVKIASIAEMQVVTGPVRVLSEREIYWQIKAGENGRHRIIFAVGDRRIEKELVIGDGFMRVSAKRPGWSWSDILLYPLEKPFGPDSPVQSVSINYPDRISHTSGTDWWLIYFFIASMVFALLFKPFLKVKI